MKNKILNGLLASSFVLSMAISPVFAQENADYVSNHTDGYLENLIPIETNTLSTGTLGVNGAKEYLSVIQKCKSTYGVANAVSGSSNTSYKNFKKGLAQSHLLDLDNDGYSELLLVYVSDENLNAWIPTVNITVEIWDTDGITTTMPYKETFSMDFGHAYTVEVQSYLIQKDGKWVLVVSYYDYGYGGISERAFARQLSNSTMHELISFTYGMGRYDDDFSGTYNGTSFSSSKYESYKAQFDKDSSNNTIFLFCMSRNSLNYTNLTLQSCESQLTELANPTPTPVTPEVSKELTATPSTAKVMLNGEFVNFGAYTIGGFNYYRLTDVAYALSGTSKQFEVTWDSEKSAIVMKTNAPHILLGDELMGNSGKEETALPFTSAVYCNGSVVNLSVYSINGFSYFALDSLKESLGFQVSWDSATSTILITT